MWKLAFRFFFLYLRIYYAKNVIIVTLSFYLDQLSVINLVSSNAEGNFFFLLKSFLAPWVAMVVRLAKAISERWTWLKAGVSFSLFPRCTEPQLSTHTTHHVHTPHIEYTHTTQKAVQGNSRCKSLWTACRKMSILLTTFCRRTAETARMYTTVTEEEKCLFPRAPLENQRSNY